MLMRFSVSNFLSFDKEQEFSMFAGKVQKFNERIIKDTDLELLKFSALYGANASGKSNLIKAIDFAKSILVNGIDSINISNSHFKLKSENKNKPTKFEFEVKLDNSYYAYGFSVRLNTFSIETEWLYEITPSKEIMIFERDMENQSFKTELSFTSQTSSSKFNIYSEDIMNMSNVLFLKEINRKNLKETDFKIFNSLFEWFNDKLIIIYPDTTISNHLKIFDRTGDFDILQLLDYFDTGITDFVYERSNVEELRRYLDEEYYNHFIETIKKPSIKAKNAGKGIKIQGMLRANRHLFQVKYNGHEWIIDKLLFKHGVNSDVMFDFGDESDGTQRLIELLGIIHEENKDKTILIDELDRSLHPKMTRKFVETFFNLTNQFKNQLIISTHESNLLNLDFLRRDEIWFVERDKNYSSKLYSLENFKVRYDKKIDKDYLEGRYGAIPVFKDFSSYFEDKS